MGEGSYGSLSMSFVGRQHLAGRVIGGLSGQTHRKLSLDSLGRDIGLGLWCMASHGCDRQSTTLAAIVRLVDQIEAPTGLSLKARRVHGGHSWGYLAPDN